VGSGRKGAQALGKWRDEKARWGCAGAAGMGAPQPKGRAGGGGARNNAYLCGRL